MIIMMPDYLLFVDALALRNLSVRVHTTDIRWDMNDQVYQLRWMCVSRSEIRNLNISTTTSPIDMIDESKD